MLNKTRAFQRPLGISKISDINHWIQNDRFKQLLEISEQRYDFQLTEIIKSIKARMPAIRLITIAGPSSSGKTTFSYRLKDALASAGIQSYTLALDNYFKDREKTPKDQNGEYDFENLEAIELKLLNSDLSQMFKGDTVRIPRYDFKEGKRLPGDSLQMAKDDVLIIEGIHGLNPRLTANIPKRNKFKIYVTAMLQLKTYRNEMIHTTMHRFIRRIVRDSQFRGYDASETIKRWPSVMRGEQQNIFPTQDQANYVFNSALLYELPVLKRFAFELLVEINKQKDVFFEARRLLSLLNYFDFSPEESLSWIPPKSTLREFIGGSEYKY